LSVGQTLQILQVWVLWRVKSREQCIGRTFQRQRIPDGQNYRHEAVLLEAQGASALIKEPPRHAFPEPHAQEASCLGNELGMSNLPLAALIMVY
jgi:hypothetical protein